MNTSLTTTARATAPPPPTSAPPTVTRLVLETTARVCRTPRHVRVAAAGVSSLAASLEDRAHLLARAPEPFPEPDLFGSDERHAQFLFIAASVNFSFWPDDEAQRWHWPHAPGEGCTDRCPPGCRPHTGAVAFGLSLRDALRRGVPVTDASYLWRLTPPEIEDLLGGSGRLPLLEERTQVLNETGRVLAKLFSGEIATLVRLASQSADDALALLFHNFPSLRDVSVLDGMPVYFLKRAQIFIADLFRIFAGRSLGRLDDVRCLTALSDYRLPQMLRAAGAIEYSPPLARHVDSCFPLRAGSREEIELRAATIQAVDALRAELGRRTGENVLACLLDGELWRLAHDDEFGDLSPHHRTRTIFY